jgi:hypothetical protein
MKVALVLTGYLRNWDFNYPYIKKEILDKYNPDVYITSYTYSRHYWHSDPEFVDVSKSIEIYKPKNYIFREVETCPSFNFKENGRERIGREYSIQQLQGWHTNYLALTLFNPDDYDIIIKLRTDIALKNFNINSDFELVVPGWKVHPGPCQPSEALVDYFAYGNSECMKKYFELHSKMQEMYDKDIADISLGETLLKDYVDHFIGIERIRFDLETDWNLRGEIWETDKVQLYRENAPEWVCCYNSNHWDGCVDP